MHRIRILIEVEIEIEDVIMDINRNYLLNYLSVCNASIYRYFRGWFVRKSLKTAKERVGTIFMNFMTAKFESELKAIKSCTTINV